MFVQLDDVIFKIGVPDVNRKVKAHTHDDFVDFAISKLSDSPRMPTQNFAGFFSVIVKNLRLQFLVLKEFLKDLFFLLALFDFKFIFFLLFRSIKLIITTITELVRVNLV